jgi:membrane protein YqaA with SNARE-associated domain
MIFFFLVVLVLGGIAGWFLGAAIRDAIEDRYK